MTFTGDDVAAAFSVGLLLGVALVLGYACWPTTRHEDAVAKAKRDAKRRKVA